MQREVPRFGQGQQVQVLHQAGQLHYLLVDGVYGLAVGLEQSCQTVFLLDHGREHDYGHVLDLAELLAQVHPIQLRQHEAKNHKVRALSFGQGEAFHTIPGRQHLVAIPPEVEPLRFPTC